MTDIVVMVREVGKQEYDVLYVSEKIRAPDGTEQLITIGHLHNLIKEALGKSEDIEKITLDDITIRNVNGIRFMLKKPNPKLEVTFVSSVQQQEQTFVPSSTSTYNNNLSTVPKTTSTPTVGGGVNQWVTVLEANPFSFGHSGTTINEQLFVFGGFADESTTNHALLLGDFSANGKFSKLKVRGTVPPPRERHTSLLISKRIYIFGGYNRGPDVYYNSIYVFESETLTWSKLEPRGNPPEPRCGHSATLVDGKMWIFGGRVKARKGEGIFADNVVEYRNDLHCYDPTTNEWLRYEPRGIGPSGRAMHSATAVGRKIYIFGGANSTGTRNDTSGFCDLYELDIDTMTWTECETQSTPPSPCYGHQASLVADDKILIFGGKGYSELSTIHILELRTMTWRQYAFAGNKLSARWGHSATFHDGKYVVIYGGRAAHGYYNSIEVIDVTSQLIEMKPEEAAKEVLRRKQEEKNKAREAMGNLQSAVHELSAMISKLGEELLEQKKLIATADVHVLRLRQENLNLKQRVADLSGDTLPPEFFDAQSKLAAHSQVTSISAESDSLPVMLDAKPGDDDIKYTNQLEEDQLSY